MTNEPAVAELPVREFTVRLSESLHRRLRQRALDDDQRMSQVVRTAVREYLDRAR